MKIKKLIPHIIFLILFFLVWDQSATAKEKVSISKKTIVMEQGETIRLKLKNTKRKVRWLSSQSMIAQVSNKGKVKANRLGKATIYAKIGKKEYRCKVTVKSDLDAKKITMNYYNSVFTKEMYERVKAVRHFSSHERIEDKAAIKVIFNLFSTLKLTESPHDPKYDETLTTGFVSYTFIMDNGEEIAATFGKQRLCVKDVEYEYDAQYIFSEVAGTIFKYYTTLR